MLETPLGLLDAVPGAYLFGNLLDDEVVSLVIVHGIDLVSVGIAGVIPYMFDPFLESLSSHSLQ